MDEKKRREAVESLAKELKITVEEALKKLNNMCAEGRKGMVGCEEYEYSGRDTGKL